MPYRKINIWRTLDWWTVGIYFVLVIAGWVTIYASTYDFDQTGMMDFSGRSGQQMIWIITSLALVFVILMIDGDWYDIFSYWLYILIIGLLIITIFLAPEIKGSRSWLRFGWFQIQPAEFAKFATALAVAKMMNGYKFQLMKFENFVKVLALISVPMLLIFLQKETGSALVYLAFFLVLYREGMPGTILLVGFSMILFFILNIKYSEVFWLTTSVGELSILLIILLTTLIWLYQSRKEKQSVIYLGWACFGILIISIAAAHYHPFNLSYAVLGILLGVSLYILALAIKFWAQRYLYILSFIFFTVGFMYSVDYVFDEMMEPHQQVRIQVSLGLKDDPSGAGYNVNQSKIAIGSGGFLGKGFLNGTQTKLKYVPEQDTDFIFCTIGEEKGFVGSAIILLILTFLIFRLIYLAERQKSVFNRIYGYSVASILFFHVAINIGMVLGLTPVIGIPLPFFSYGGSSLWGFTILLFIFIRLDASRSERM